MALFQQTGCVLPVAKKRSIKVNL